MKTNTIHGINALEIVHNMLKDHVDKLSGNPPF